MSLDTALVYVKSLGKKYGRKKALDEISFRISQGKITGFLGPNGAGKSTTIKCLLGLIGKDSGEILVRGAKLTEPQEIRFKIRVGALLEFHTLFPVLTARENLDLLSRCDQKKPDHTKIDRLLDMVGLNNVQNIKVKAFSLGMRQKLALASVFLNEPELLVLDEPFNGLDPNAMDNLNSLLKNYAGNGGSVFISSHFLAEVEDLCDGIIIINEGKIVKEGNVRDITKTKNLKTLYLEVTGAGNV